MRNTDRKAFVEVILGFAELKGKQLSAPAIEIYWRSMQQWNIDDFRGVAEHLLRTCEFMPTPKDFEMIRRVNLPTSGEAWAKALKMCACWRGGDTPGGAIDRAAQAVGGYRAIAFTEDDDLPFIEQRFKRAYDDLCDVESARESAPQISAPIDTRPRIGGLRHIGALEFK